MNLQNVNMPNNLLYSLTNYQINPMIKWAMNKIQTQRERTNKGYNKNYNIAFITCCITPSN